MMIVFDDILVQLNRIFTPYAAILSEMQKLIVNRDLYGRARLIAESTLQNNSTVHQALIEIAARMDEELRPHSFPKEQTILWEDDLEALLEGKSSFDLDGFPNIKVIDRLAIESDWSAISPATPLAPRIVFYSIKGGVGRSTALTATAWALAEANKRVLVLDLDLESPGLSSMLLAADRRPDHGIVDWLVEDLVDNGSAIINRMIGTSTLSREGEIYVVPAHGRGPGEYITKLGRIWMPKLDAFGKREAWPERIARMIAILEKTCKPDVILIDSRSGIDDMASACLTSLGASLILLFAIEGDQTWTAYRVIFNHWLKTDVVRHIRDRLQVVGAMIPEVAPTKYLESLQETSWDVFSEELYDAVPAGAGVDIPDLFSFDRSDENAPHSPWPIRWNRGLTSLANLHAGFEGLDHDAVNGVFGPVIEGIMRVTGGATRDE